VNAQPDSDRDPIRYIDWYESPVGPLLVSATASAVCGLSFCEAGDLQRRMQGLRERHQTSLATEGDSPLEALQAQLREYFQGRRREFTVPLSYVVGSEFQQRVWAALCEIPYGDTWSYLQLAVRVGDALATRAVGYANGANPIAIVVPCHRVINADGGEGGYGGGLWRKRILLDLERGQRTLGF
jgi:O-6-methylguanine DNA methyltransferase